MPKSWKRKREEKEDETSEEEDFHVYLEGSRLFQLRFELGSTH